MLSFYYLLLTTYHLKLEGYIYKIKNKNKKPYCLEVLVLDITKSNKFFFFLVLHYNWCIKIVSIII